jgi:hypothetical protein
MSFDPPRKRRFEQKRMRQTVGALITSRPFFFNLMRTVENKRDSLAEQVTLLSRMWF